MAQPQKPKPVRRAHRHGHLAELREALVSPQFWTLLGWSVVVLAIGAGLLWLAIKTFDSGMSLRPMVCRGGNTDWYVLAISVSAPFFGIGVLGAISEVWHNLEYKRRNIPRRWGAFAAFTGLVVMTAFVILTALNC
jgi:hypothetical protein